MCVVYMLYTNVTCPEHVTCTCRSSGTALDGQALAGLLLGQSAKFILLY